MLHDAELELRLAELIADRSLPASVREMAREQLAWVRHQAVERNSRYAEPAQA
jgi:hypothetical protein